jgi:hypothetical protein
MNSLPMCSCIAAAPMASTNSTRDSNLERFREIRFPENIAE